MFPNIRTKIVNRGGTRIFAPLNRERKKTKPKKMKVEIQPVQVEIIDIISSSDEDQAPAPLPKQRKKKGKKKKKRRLSDDEADAPPSKRRKKSSPKPRRKKKSKSKSKKKSTPKKKSKTKKRRLESDADNEPEPEAKKRRVVEESVVDRVKKTPRPQDLSSNRDSRRKSRELEKNIKQTKLPRSRKCLRSDDDATTEPSDVEMPDLNDWSGDEASDDDCGLTRKASYVDDDGVLRFNPKPWMHVSEPWIAARDKGPWSKERVLPKMKWMADHNYRVKFNSRWIAGFFGINYFINSRGAWGMETVVEYYPKNGIVEIDRIDIRTLIFTSHSHPQIEEFKHIFFNIHGVFRRTRLCGCFPPAVRNTVVCVIR